MSDHSQMLVDIVAQDIVDELVATLKEWKCKIFSIRFVRTYFSKLASLKYFHIQIYILYNYVSENLGPLKKSQNFSYPTFLGNIFSDPS